MEKRERQHLGAPVLPSALLTASASTFIIFRGSITQPTHSLSTLRGCGRPHAARKTRFRPMVIFAGRGQPRGEIKKVSVIVFQTMASPPPRTLAPVR